MSIRVAINGFGRMGRHTLRIAWNWPELKIVHVNEIKGGGSPRQATCSNSIRYMAVGTGTSGWSAAHL